MQNILILCTEAPYGSESLYNALRLAIALKEQEECQIELRIFMLADSVTVALNGQAPTDGYNLRQMLEILTAQKVPMRLCKTCTDSRGISGLPLIDGIEIGTMPLLARWTVEADKVLNF
ncbi:MAG: DsrE family protein [Aeromonadaceae bacterium]|nr:DsrE family protein [Aeromonadaceae bacterium]MBP9569408.1 DsrE family protein [Aeromonadaceae bacterium]